MSILGRINHPSDVKGLSDEELKNLAEEIRRRIIHVTSKNGGHIGPNLGVVELTLALHRQFDTPQDKFLFDVSHQGYVHKLLTGRKDGRFDKIRLTDGLSGFLSRSESEHDAYGAGHAGTALSAALGFAVARDLKGASNHVVAVVGDAAFTCGITHEALNNIASQTKRLIVILNDNEWSIDKNVGSIANYFNELITNPVYNRLDKDLSAFFEKMPGGNSVIRLARKWKKGTKDFLVSSSLFETYGLRYVGPIDGHDIGLLEKYLAFAKQLDHPILLHVLTKKGKGYEPAVAAPEKFHGVSPFDVATGKGRKKVGAPPSYQDAFGQTLLRFAELDERIVGITAAMPPGTGLVYLREDRPKQYFDVGIAEEHAVLFAAGMAAEGAKPVVAIYSTFLQRAYDCIIHDVCLQNLPIVFCMDRAGLSPNDGPTHHGLFDIAYLRCAPNVCLMQPADEDELADMLWTGLELGSPAFIRYPRGSATGKQIKEKPEVLEIGKAKILRPGEEIQFWALGPWTAVAEQLADWLTADGVSAGVVNARFIKPLDRDLLRSHAENASLIVTMEDHVVTGGFGSAVLEALNEMGLKVPVEVVGWPDEFVGHASSQADLRAQHGLDEQTLYNRVLWRYKSLTGNKRTATAWE